MLARRRSLDSLFLPNSPARSRFDHAGLLLARCLERIVRETDTPREKEDSQKAREQLHATAIAAADRAASEPFYRSAVERWVANFPPATRHAPLTPRGALVLGLGSDNVLEAGLTLHHTYGVPVIPGSALKGLASHYAHQVWGRRADLGDEAKRFRMDGDLHQFLFGETDERGAITFHDALPSAGQRGLLAADVMTPHHGDYYGSDGADRPSDFDDPNPVTFVSVRGAFHFAVSLADDDATCQAGESRDAYLNMAWTMLLESLAAWGVGGKTSSGYGRFGEQPTYGVASSGKAAGVNVPVAGTWKAGESLTVRCSAVVGGKPKYVAPDGMAARFHPTGPAEPQVGQEFEVFWMRKEASLTPCHVVTLTKPAEKTPGKSGPSKR